MIRASELLHRATDRLHEDLHALVTRRLPGEGFEARRALVAQFVHTSRRALTQLLILLEWLRARRAQTQAPLEEGAALVQAEAEQLRLTLDRLFYAHRDLFRKRVASRPYDLPTALDLLAQGSTAERFPRELDLSLQSGAAAECPTVEELNHAIHAALILREGVPPQYSQARVEHGVLRLEDWHQFALSLTLESTADPATAPWRLLDLHFLLPRLPVDQEAGAAEQQPPQQLYHSLEPDARQRQRVFELLMGVLESGPEPLLGAYRVCRALCDGLRLEMLALQAKPLSSSSSSQGATGPDGGAGAVHVTHEAGQSLELRFWRGLPLLPPAGEGSDGDDAMDQEEEQQQEDPIDKGQRVCVLRVALEGKPAKRLRATCRHRLLSQGWWDTGGGRSLAMDPARVSLPGLMEQAYQRLVPARLRWLRDQVEGDPALGPLLADGLSLQESPGGMGLELRIAGARLAVGVDRRAGHFVLDAGAGLEKGDEDLSILVSEWEAALRADPALAAPRAAEASSRLLRDMLRALLLRRVAGVARARYDLPSDARWRRLLLVGAAESGVEEGENGGMEEEDELKANRAAATSVYLTLAATGAVLPDSTGAALGGAWQLLEVEITDLALEPQAYLVTAAPSISSTTATALPALQARRRLAVPATGAAVGEEGLAAWVGSAVAAARAAMPLAGVIDGVAGALALPGLVPEGALEAVRGGGQEVELLQAPSNGQGKDRVVDALSVRRDAAAGAWRWRARVPALVALGRGGSGMVVGRGEQVLVDDLAGGGKRMALAWGRGEEGVVEVSVEGAWAPLAHVHRLSRALAALATLATLAATAAAAAGEALHGFELVKGAGAVPELRFRETSSNVLLALRHPGLLDSTDDPVDGTLRLALLDAADPAKAVLAAGARCWRAAEEALARTGDLPALFQRIRPLTRPLHALGTAAVAAAAAAGKGGEGPPLDVWAWAPTTVAVSLGDERLLLVTVVEGVVRVTQHDEAVTDGARSQSEWAVGEFTMEVARGEVAFLFEGSS